MKKIPSFPPSLRIEVLSQVLSDLTLENEETPDDFIKSFMEFHSEIKPFELKKIQKQEYVELLWEKALKLDSPHMLLAFIKSGWSPILKTTKHPFYFEEPISWGWIALGLQAKECFKFIVRIPTLKEVFLKDAKTTPVVNMLLCSLDKPVHWMNVFELTPLLEQRLYDGGTFLHQLTQRGLWDDAYDYNLDEYVSSPWISWAKGNACHLIDRQDFLKRTAFDMTNNTLSTNFEVLKIELEKALYEKNLNKASVSSSKKNQRI